MRAATPEQSALGVQNVTPAGEIPFELGPRERAVDATASFKKPQSLRLADVTVLSLHDRTVTLRFTMGGIPLPPFSTTCTPGQALVSVRVNTLTLPRPH